MVRSKLLLAGTLCIVISLTYSLFPASVHAQSNPGAPAGAVVAQTDEAVAVVTAPPAAPELPDLILIDNDDEKANAMVEETYKWQELPDSTGKTKLVTGAKFPVRVASELTSKTAKVGDPVEGMLRVDLRINGKLIAPKGTRVVGHVFSVMPARRMLHAELSKKRWFRANGEIGIQFDEIITHEGDHLPLIAKPAQQARIVDNRAEGRLLGVNKNGEVATPLSSQLKAQAIHLAIRGAASAGGAFSFGIVPVAYAAVGAMNPSFAFLHPVGLNVPHRRLKGAAMGFVSGVPGGFLIADTIIRGSEASIRPGDEFLVEFKQDFTGEPGGDAELLGGATKGVHGEVVKKDGEAAKKK
jgi:hypothetical protein